MAEQFLMVLRIFNVSINEFVRPLPTELDLRNALARLGATHLQESAHGLPSGQLDEVHRVVKEALVDASPRVVTAIAPVLVNNASLINFWKLAEGLESIGRQRRVPWVVENTSAALELLGTRNPGLAASHRYRAAQVRFEMFAKSADRIAVTGELDVLDQTIGSIETLRDVTRTRSSISQRWAIVSALQPDDFADALEAAA